MRQVSPKRRARDKPLPAARQAVWDRSDGWCEALISEDCSGTMTDVHHKAGRGGPDPHRLDNLLGVCRACHMWIESNRERSYGIGHLIRRNQERAS